MSNKKKSHDVLQLASYLFLLVGVIALLQMGLAAFRGTFHFNFGIFGIGIFAGLRRYSPIWRTCALVFTWYSMITIGLALMVSFYVEAAAAAPRYGRSAFASVPIHWVVFPLLALFLVTFWQYRVLTHPAIRRLFVQPRAVLASASSTVAEEIEGVPVK